MNKAPAATAVPIVLGRPSASTRFLHGRLPSLYVIAKVKEFHCNSGWMESVLTSCSPIQNLSSSFCTSVILACETEAGVDESPILGGVIGSRLGESLSLGSCVGGYGRCIIYVVELVVDFKNKRGKSTLKCPVCGTRLLITR